MAALLATVAALGVVRSISLDQSSWQGASFGMFATYDNRSSRLVLVRVERSGAQELVSLPAGLEAEADRLRAVPTVGAARGLAEAVLDRRPDAEAIVVEVRGLVLGGGEALEATGRTIVRARAAR